MAEINLATLCVLQTPVGQDLEEQLKNIRVSLLDFIEQDHRVRSAPDRLGQYTAFLVSNVPGGRTLE